jgi:hypothetical protein
MVMAVSDAVYPQVDDTDTSVKIHLVCFRSWPLAPGLIDLSQISCSHPDA